MAELNEIQEGGCACGAVRFTTTGAPLRAGLCHCMTCRKAHSSAFNPFVVFTLDQVEVQGELSDWLCSPGFVLSFCPKCGSRVCGGDGEEIELSLGSFDHPGLFRPQYELWIGRREPWLAAMDIPQHETNRG
jgi:hypothetical protein